MKYAFIFISVKYRKFSIHIWNMHLYFHLWNTENSIFIYEIYICFPLWNVFLSMKYASIFSSMKYRKFYFYVWHQSASQFSCSVMSDSATPQITAHQASLSITNSQSPPKPMSIESVMPSNHLILCHPLLLLLPIFPSIRVFSNESALHIRWPKYWSFSCNISPSNEYSGLVSFRRDWLDLLVVQGILKSLLQHHSSKASIFRRSDFFTVQLSHPYLSRGKPQPWLDGPLLTK